jgi:hypothetical protein
MPKACFSPTTPCYSFPVLPTSMQTLAGFWASFNPEKELAKEVIAPWGDIVGYPEDDPIELPPLDDQPSPEQAVDDISGLTDSPGGNLIRPPPPPTHGVSFSMQQPPKVLQIQDPDLDSIMVKGTPLPPPRAAPSVFISTHPTPLMDQNCYKLEC